MDKVQYDDKVVEMIGSGPYEELKFRNGRPKDPLNNMILEAKNCAKVVSNLLKDKFWNLKMKVSNPKVACLYALPKIHKNPLAMRPIASNNNVPMEKQAEWLVEKLKSYPIDFGFSIKNTKELVNKIGNLKLRKGEIMGSFDIVNMYPNVPVDLAIKAMEKHLISKGAPPNIIGACVLIATTTMEQNFFQFRGKFYKQNFGLSMGAKVSPYLANVFFSELEEKLKNNPGFPRVWFRYVDDIFVVIKERYVQQFLDFLNSQHETIRFTFEKESNNTIPFLDILISRKEDNGIKFSIYRKTTHTDRYITSDSHHSGGHKQAAFHSMIHRLLNIPMEETDFKKEREYVYRVAELNGFHKNFIDKIIRKHQNKINLSEITNLQPKESSAKYISVPFFPKITNKLQDVMKKYEIKLVTKSDSNIKNFLCNYKDKTPLLHNSGIYAEYCRDCNNIYIGQTKRKLVERHKDHMRAIEHNLHLKSAVADHMKEFHHNLDSSKFEKLKTVRNPQHLNAWESLFIQKSNTPLMNKDPAPISSSLFKYAKL